MTNQILDEKSCILRKEKELCFLGSAAWRVLPKTSKKSYEHEIEFVFDTQKKKLKNKIGYHTRQRKIL